MADKKSEKTCSKATYEMVDLSSYGESVSLYKAIGLSESESQEIEYGQEDQIAPPIYNYDNLHLVANNSDVISSNIRAIEQNTVGFGFGFVPVDDDVIKNESEQKRYEEQSKILKKFFKNPNDQFQTLTQIFTLALRDREIYGTGYIEVRRNQGGDIIALYHVPAKRIRARKDMVRKEDGEVQKRGYGYYSGKNISGAPTSYFKNFGDERKMDYLTGKYNTTHGYKREASEIIEIRNHSTETIYYGEPQFKPAEQAIVGNVFAATSNNSKFKNNCVPDKIIVVNNGRIVSGKNDLAKYFQNGLKGPDNAGKTILVEVEGDIVGDITKDTQMKSAVTVIDLNKWNEADFMEFMQQNDIRIRRMYRIPKIVLGETEDVNRATANAAKEMAEQQVFSPIRIEIDEIVNRTIVADILGRNKFNEIVVRFQFNKMLIKDPDYVLNKIGVMNTSGIASINEMRKTLGMPEYNGDGKELADVPVKILSLMIAASIATDNAEATVKETEKIFHNHLVKMAGSNNIAKSLVMMMDAYNGKVE